MSYNNVRGTNGISKKRSGYTNGSDVLHSIEIDSFESGANTHGGAMILNMQHDGEALRTRKAPTIFDMGEDVPNTATQAECFGNGRYVFKRSNCLFLYDIKTQKCYKERDDLPEREKCVIYHINSRFAVLFENGDVYTVSDDLTHKTEKTSVYIPIIYMLYADRTEKREEFNFLTEYFRVHLNLVSGGTCELPTELNIDGDFAKVYTLLGVDLGSDAVGITVHEGGGATLANRTMHGNLIVTLRLKRSETAPSAIFDKIEKNKDLLFFSLGSDVFPSVSQGKTDLLLYGGKRAESLAFFCIDQNFFVAEKDMITFENSENITSVLRYSEDYLIFSPNFIRKMTVTEDEAADIRFNIAVENFKYDVGCDIPKSAVCTDDKIIYANSKAGVFYLDRFGFSQRDMSRNVSANIEEGENGLFSLDEKVLKNAQAVICGGKYYLFAGDVFYVWDFKYCVPSSSTEKLSESVKMRWTLGNAVSCKRIVGEDINEFYFVTERDELANFSSREEPEGEAQNCFYRSAEQKLAPFGEAVIFKLSLSMSLQKSAVVRCYFDGAPSVAKHVLSPSDGNINLYVIKPMRRKCRRFAFSVNSEGDVRLDGAKIEWY